MIITIGSKNPVKINAVREVLTEYEFLKDAEVRGVETASLVSNQPKSLDETIRGAFNRARGAIKYNSNILYGIGLESGLMKVLLSHSGYLNVCACVIVNKNENYALGLSSAFEYPQEVIESIFRDNLDVNQAFYRLNYTPDQKVGSSIGAIGILSQGKLNRKEYLQQSLRNALIQLQNKEDYYIYD